MGIPESHVFCQETIAKLQNENNALRAKLRRYEKTYSSLETETLNRLAYAFAEKSKNPTDTESKLATYLLNVETHIQKLRVIGASAHTLRKLERAGWAWTLATQYYAPEVKEREPNDPAILEGPKVVLFCEKGERREAFFGQDFEDCCQAADSLVKGFLGFL